MHAEQLHRRMAVFLPALALGPDRAGTGQRRHVRRRCDAVQAGPPACRVQGRAYRAPVAEAEQADLAAEIGIDRIARAVDQQRRGRPLDRPTGIVPRGRQARRHRCDRRRQPRRFGGQAESHLAAIGVAGDIYPLRIDAVFLGQPRHQRAEESHVIDVTQPRRIAGGLAAIVPVALEAVRVGHQETFLRRQPVEAVAADAAHLRAVAP